MPLTVDSALWISGTIKTVLAVVVIGTLWYGSRRYGGPAHTAARGGSILLIVAVAAWVVSTVLGISERL